MGLNNTVLQGRLARDVELKFAGNGTAILNNALAVERNFKGKDGNRETDFINIVAFSKTAEMINEYFSKGDGITISGRIQTNQYEDKQGNNRTSTDVVVNEFNFPLTRKDNDKQQSNEQNSDPFEDEQINITDNDLPF